MWMCACDAHAGFLWVAGFCFSCGLPLFIQQLKKETAVYSLATPCCISFHHKVAHIVQHAQFMSQMWGANGYCKQISLAIYILAVACTYWYIQISGSITIHLDWASFLIPECHAVKKLHTIFINSRSLFQHVRSPKFFEWESKCTSWTSDLAESQLYCMTLLAEHPPIDKDMHAALCSVWQSDEVYTNKKHSIAISNLVAS